MTQPNPSVIQLPAQTDRGYPNLSFPAAISLFRKLRKSVYDKRPMIKDILHKSGSLSLHNFTKSHITTQQYGQEERKEQFVTVLTQVIQDLLGSSIAESVAKQIRKYPHIITADHHGPLGYQGFVTSNLLESMAYQEVKDETLKNIVVLACANVSFDNYSFPRGLQFHSYVQNQMFTNKFGFYSWKVKGPCPVVYYPAYTTDDIIYTKRRLALYLRENLATKNKIEKISFLLDEIYAKPSVLAYRYFSEQVTVTNAQLWQNLFHQNTRHVPNLVYLEQESIINHLLIQYHLYHDTVIHQILFNSDYHKSILKYFDGIMGAFSSEDNSGTFLFWALPKGQKHRVQMRKKGRFLVSPDESYQVELIPEAIHTAILNKEIFPSTLLSFTILSFYHGIRLLGGFNQTTYLTQMKEAYIAMEKEISDIKNLTLTIPTADMVFTRPIAYLQNAGQKVPATGLDLMLYGNEQTLPLMQQAAKQISLREAIYARLIPYVYRTYYPKEEQDINLLAITEEDIEKSIGLDKKYHFLDFYMHVK